MTTQSGDNVHVYGNPLSDGQDAIDPTEPALDGLPENSSFEEDTASSKITGAPGRAHLIHLHAQQTCQLRWADHQRIFA
jgi:hypothetical protein